MTLRIIGANPHLAFGNEAGGHRWQRVPPTERKGRVHTSTITVAVLPEPADSALVVNERDLEWTTTRGTGPGGQHRNKTESAVTLKHQPSGLVVRCQSERSQLRNKQSALAVLKARLWQAENDRTARASNNQRRQQIGSGMRGDKRRTIRLQDGIVTDHVLGKRWRLREYLNGEW